LIKAKKDGHGHVKSVNYATTPTGGNMRLEKIRKIAEREEYACFQ